jgi:hypothetical protein
MNVAHDPVGGRQVAYAQISAMTLNPRGTIHHDFTPRGMAMTTWESGSICLARQQPATAEVFPIIACFEPNRRNPDDNYGIRQEILYRNITRGFTL